MAQEARTRRNFFIGKKLVEFEAAAEQETRTVDSLVVDGGTTMKEIGLRSSVVPKHTG